MSSNIARSLALDYGLPASRARVAGVGSNAMRAAGAEADPLRFGRRRILFVGVDWERKGGPVLVEAFRRLRRVHPEAELEIVGCTPDVREPGCHVVGRIPLDAVSDHYLSATVFCLPTRMEPFGIVFIEALAHGLPIVGTPIGAIPDLVEGGRTGCLVPPDDPQALADALDRLLRDPALCRRLGSEGEALVRERYTWEATACRIANAVRGQLGEAANGFTPAASGA
jgi:glycosyltransferase involved in cell wall biosynthesis